MDLGAELLKDYIGEQRESREVTIKLITQMELLNKNLNNGILGMLIKKIDRVTILIAGVIVSLVAILLRVFF